MYGRLISIAVHTPELVLCSLHSISDKRNEGMKRYNKVNN